MREVIRKRYFQIKISVTEDFDVKHIFDEIEKVNREIEKVREALKILENLRSEEIQKRLWWYLEDLHTKKRELYHRLLMVSKVEEFREISE